MHLRNHVDSRVGVDGTNGFARGIPARAEGYEVCCTAGGFVISPPGFQLLVSSFRVCRPADPDMSSPYSGVSMGWHDDLLLSETIFTGVRCVQPTA
jgi:hypothetical protein